MKHRNMVSGRSVIFLLCAFSVLAPVVSADIIHIPADKPTIQDGIGAAINGDTVLVADGVYTGTGNRDIDLLGKTITVTSENGVENCIIDCQGSAAEPHRGFTLHGGETTLAVIEGFTIRNGYAAGVDLAGCGGGILIESGSEATIRGNRIESCHADSAGGGLFIDGTNYSSVVGNTITGCDADYGGGGYTEYAVEFRDNLISGNTAEYGGGLFSYPVTLQGDRIIDNHAVYGGGIATNFNGSILAANCLIAGNHADLDGGGCWGTDYSYWYLINCTVTGNTAGNLGGGIYYEYCTVGFLIFEDCILWGNTPNSIDGGVGPYCVDMFHTDIEGGWPGLGNFDADPLLVNGPLGGCYLSQTAAGEAVDSPCLNAGSDLATMICFDYVGDPICMSEMTTRSDQALDTVQADLGYHYPVLHTVSASITCVPSVGTLPFAATMNVVMENLLSAQTRRVAGRIDVQLGGGLFVSNWRAGFTNISGGNSYSNSWLQNLPARLSLVGDNLFSLVAVDVTPAPWNLPPYPPAGDVFMDDCTITGEAP